MSKTYEVLLEDKELSTAHELVGDCHEWILHQLKECRHKSNHMDMFNNNCNPVAAEELANRALRLLTLFNRLNEERDKLHDKALNEEII